MDLLPGRLDPIDLIRYLGDHPELYCCGSQLLDSDHGSLPASAGAMADPIQGAGNPTAEPSPRHQLPISLPGPFHRGISRRGLSLGLPLATYRGAANAGVAELDEAAEGLEHPSRQGIELLAPGRGLFQHPRCLRRLHSLGKLPRILMRPLSYHGRRHLQVELERVGDPSEAESERLVLAGLRTRQPDRSAGEGKGIPMPLQYREAIRQAGEEGIPLALLV